MHGIIFPLHTKPAARSFVTQIYAMTPASTHDLLLLHLTNELAPAERNAFEHVLISDQELQQDYRDFAAILQTLDQPLQFSPKESTIRLLLDYAKA